MGRPRKQPVTTSSEVTKKPTLREIAEQIGCSGTQVQKTLEVAMTKLIFSLLGDQDIHKEYDGDSIKLLRALHDTHEMELELLGRIYKSLTERHPVIKRYWSI